MWRRDVGYTRIKLCEFESLDATIEAAELGADALGFHVLNGRTGSQATELFEPMVKFLRPDVESVLLSDIGFKELAALLRRVPFTAVQLYPNWHPDRIEELRSAFPDTRWLKVMSAKPSENEGLTDLEFLDRYKDCCEAILLDSSKAGGTGEVADWDHCAQIVRSSSLPVFLAGGLTAANVGEAIAKVRPFGVDVETGVSTRLPNGPLVKDMRKCARFIEAVARADRDELRRLSAMRLTGAPRPGQ